VEVYGSFATGLWVESSNVNLLIVRRDFPYDFNAVSPKELLEKIFDSLKKANICREISFTRNVRMPSIAV
jgi:predicted nucleotidyltransferase